MASDHGQLSTIVEAFSQWVYPQPFPSWSASTALLHVHQQFSITVPSLLLPLLSDHHPSLLVGVHSHRPPPALLSPSFPFELWLARPACGEPLRRGDGRLRRRFSRQISSPIPIEGEKEKHGVEIEVKHLLVVFFYSPFQYFFLFGFWIS